MEAMLSGNSLDKIFIQEDIKNDQVKELKDLARNLGVSVIKAPKEKLSKLCRIVVAFQLIKLDKRRHLIFKSCLGCCNNTSQITYLPLLHSHI